MKSKGTKRDGQNRH